VSSAARRLAEQPIALPSVTPEDGGCPEAIAERPRHDRGTLERFVA
jgi:hypothetical protein